MNRYLTTRNLLIVTAITELGAGLMLLCCPSTSARILFATQLEEPSALTIARIGGSGLFALGIACWTARNDTQSRSAMGLVAAMLFYDIAAALLLTYAGIAFRQQGPLLWPGVILHTAMTAWCIARLHRN